jgi:hypothetical protein
MGRVPPRAFGQEADVGALSSECLESGQPRESTKGANPPFENGAHHDRLWRVAALIRKS